MRNRLFVKTAFPTRSRIMHKPQTSYATNNVLMQVCLQYGHIGAGKTETARKLAEIAVETYGEDNVNAVYSNTGSIDDVIDAFDNKMVQFLCVDDATLKKFDSDSMADFFRARHIYKEKTGNSNGYILILFNVHRFHGLQTELRTNIDLAIWRTPPTNPYDNSVVKRFVGEDGLNDLLVLEELRQEDPKYNSISVFTTRTKKGLLVLPLAINNYLRELDLHSSNIYTVDLSRELFKRIIY